MAAPTITLTFVTQDVKRWRSPRWQRTLIAVVGGAFAGLNVLLVIVGATADNAGVPSDASFTGRFMLLVFVPIFAVVAWRGIFHPSLVLDDAGVVVTNPIHTTRVRWDDVLACECVNDDLGVSCITIDRRSGPPVKAYAVHNTGWRFSKPRPEGNNMDRACATIMRTAEDHRSVASR